MVCARGCSRGTQYRHGIYPNSAEQRETAEAVLAKVGEHKTLGPVKTEVVDAAAWWPAEDYHQQGARRFARSRLVSCLLPWLTSGCVRMIAPGAVSAKGRPEREKGGRGDDSMLRLSMRGEWSCGGSTALSVSAFFPMYATTARLPLRGVDGIMMDLTETREFPGWILTPVPKAATTGKAEVRGAAIVRDGEEKLRSSHLAISV